MTRRFLALSLLALAAPVLALSAQQPTKPAAPAGAAAAAAPAPDPCPIDSMTPTMLGIATLQRTKLSSVKTLDDANKVMRDVAKLLFDDKVKVNPLGRDYVLGGFVTFEIQFADSAKRGDLGFPGDKTQYVDLLKFSDSLFTTVESAEPKCKNKTRGWRDYKPYAERIKAAYAAVNAGSADTAEKLATRAMILDHFGPQAYDVLWRVAKIRQDEQHELSYLQMAADKLEGDTLNSNIRLGLLFQLGLFQQEFGMAKADKAAKDKLYRDAAKTFLQVLREFPTSEDAAAAMQGVTISANVVGDTSISNAAVAVVKESLDIFNDQTAAQAGMLSVGANNAANALVFFSAAVKKNPYFRDYLFDLGEIMAAEKQYAAMIPVAHKLVEIDPSNPDDLTLFTEGFAGLANLAKDPAMKKAPIDSVKYYGDLAAAMPHRLVVTGFERMKSRTLLSGSVDNRAKDARPFTIDFEFIGKDGAVLATATATVAAVAPGGTGTFKLDIPVGGVMGVRYAPLK